MTCRSPLAMVLRDVRHGRAALAAGYPWRAKLSVATAEGHMTRAYRRLDFRTHDPADIEFRRYLMSKDFATYERRLFHWRERLLMVRWLLDAFADEVERQLPCSLNTKSKEKRHG